MLIEFSVENFRSIKEKVTFSMVATKDSSLDRNLILGALDNECLLKSAAIYGANASGKTNLLMAMDVLKFLVINSHNFQKGVQMPYYPFRSGKSNQDTPTRMEITFLQEKVLYHYEISYNKTQVISESLYYYPNKRKSLIFKRSDSIDYQFTKNMRKQKEISERTLSSVLYLSKATQENYDLTSNAFEWFQNTLCIIIPGNHEWDDYRFTANMINEDSGMKEKILDAMNQADLGIEDIVVKRTKLPEEDKNKLPKPILDMFSKSSQDLELYSIVTYHKGMLFSFENEESEGTKRMFFLIGYWIDALIHGKVLVVDEIDIKLHPLLIHFLIKLFHDSNSNTKRSQLIFTTHNTSILDLNIFRRDQIWFTERRSEELSTDIYSLAEYSPRKDQDIEKRYFTGKYGGLPFIGDGLIL